MLTIPAMSKYRRWCFTLNNPEVVNYDSWKAAYIAVGLETAPSTGTLHHQGYVRFTNPRALDGVRMLLPTAHWEAARASEDACSVYCLKGGNVVVHSGDKAVGQGKRSDLAIARECVQSGENMRQIAAKVNSFQGIRAGELLLKYLEPGRNFKPTVWWFYGPTGVGKSFAAKTLLPNAWWSGKNHQWFEGYDAHEEVIFDDARGDFSPFHILLRLLDENPYRIENKGGSRQFLARRIILTSPLPPHRFYRDRSGEDLQQLGRRIDHIVHFVSRNEAYEMPGTMIGGEPHDQWAVPKIANEGILAPSVPEQKCGTEVGGNTTDASARSSPILTDGADADVRPAPTSSVPLDEWIEDFINEIYE